MEYVDVCAANEIELGGGRPFRVAGTDVALFNVGGRLHAIENSCLHNGASLAAGRLCGNFVACPAHGWRFDVVTGRLAIAPERGVASFPVKVEDGRVLVRVGRTGA